MCSVSCKPVYTVGTEALPLSLTVNRQGITVLKTPDLLAVSLHEVEYPYILLEFLFFESQLLDCMIKVDLKIILNKLRILLSENTFVVKLVLRANVSIFRLGSRGMPLQID